MKFPLSYKKLDHIFLNARDPDIEDMQGEFTVHLLSLLPSLKRLSHRKCLYKDGKGYKGYNKLGFTWGHFSVTDGRVKEKSNVKTVMLNYDLENNFFLLRNIRDHVRCIKHKEIYIGRFYYLFFGYPLCIGYFSLEKIQ